jgi:hypothetical protein
VEATGKAAIAGHIAEGGHEVVLNEASNHMILPPRALVNCPVSSILPKSMRGSENTIRRHGRKSSKRGPIRIWIPYNLHIYRVHDMF